MDAGAWPARIKNGTMEIPAVYREQCKAQVRVIFLAEEARLSMDIIAQLLQHPLKVAEFTPRIREEMYI